MGEREFIALWIALPAVLFAAGAAGAGGAPDPSTRRFILVCSDGGAGGYEAFPDVCRLADGRLMCVFYAGYGHVLLPNAAHPKGGRIDCCTSSDEGRTWSAPAGRPNGSRPRCGPRSAAHTRRWVR